MAVESSAVQIVINVTDANSGAAVAGVEQNISKLGAAGTRSGQQVKKGMEEMGAAGTRSGQQVKKGMEEMGAGALSAHERVRLLSEEFGVRIPRAMQSVISKSPAVMSVINGLGGALIGLGAVQIGAMVFESLYKGAEKLWTAFTALPKAVQDYETEVQKTKEQDFGNTHSIETTRMRIDEASEALRRYTELSEHAGATWLWSAKHEQLAAASKVIDARKILDTLQHLSEAEQAHEQRSSDIDLKYAGNVGLTGKARRDATVAEARDRAHEERFYGTEQDKALGNPVAANAGADKEAREVAIARIKADAELANQQKGHSRDAKSQAQELARIHEQALESGMRGSALYHQQESAAIEDLKHRGISSAQAVEDVHTKFHNEEMNRLAEEERATGQMERQAKLSGLTGTARIQQEGANRVEEINDEDLDPAQKARRLAAAQHETSTALDEQRTRDSQEAQRELDRRAEQTRHASQETIHIEEQARVRGLSAEKQKTASIQAELDERLQKYQEELNNQEISQDDFNRRSVAAEREASAEKAEANAEARKKMAGEFDSFFKGMKDSRKYLIEQGDKAAGNAAATLWQHFQQRGKSDQGDAGAGKKGGLFDDLLGSVGVKRHGHGADAKAEQPGGHETHAAEKMFSVSHATIQIGSASFAGGGFGGGSTAGGSTAGGNASLGAPGSTSLLAPGGSVASPEAGAPTGATGARLGASGAATGMDGMMEGGAPGISGGGAGDSGGAGSSISSRINSGIGIAKQGYGLVKQIGSSFGGAGSGSGSGDGGANSGDAGDVGAGISGGGAEDSGGAGLMAGGNGSFTTASGNQVVDASSLGPSGDGESSSSIAGTQSAAGGGGMAAAGGVVAGGLGVYSASQGSGGAGGAMKGAASGAEVGAAFGPIGMAVGAVVGGVIGYMGSGKEARKYDIKEVRPHIANTLSGFENGSMDYSSAYADMQSLQTEAFKVTDKMGHSGRTYRNEYITPEIHQAEGKLTSMERSGRSQYTTSGATYDVGSDYVPGTGWNLNHLGERIMPSDQNERITRAIESQGRMPVQSSSMGDVHLHVHAIDARGVSAFLDQYKHNILAATNDARGENSGGGYN